MGAVPDASGGVVSTGSMVSDDGSGTGEVLGLGEGWCSPSLHLAVDRQRDSLFPEANPFDLGPAPAMLTYTRFRRLHDRFDKLHMVYVLLCDICLIWVYCLIDEL